MALSSSGSSAESAGSRLRISCRLPSTTISKLLKSWAMPPVSWPIASSFCAWNSCSRASSSARWVALRSVTSRVILAKPITRPVASRIGSITTLAQKVVPSLRTRSASFSNRPSRSAVSSARCGMPAARSSSV